MPDTQQVAAVVYNPIKVDLDAIRAAVAREQEANGWGETLWFETSEQDAGQGMTAEALEQGARLVIAAGGDGTVRAVAEAVAGSDASLALLPAGTGNLLARNLKLTLDDVDHSIHTAFAGEDRAVDLGRITIEGDDGARSSHAFVVMAGLGLDAQMLANTDDELKAKIGWLAYVRALGTAMRDKNQLNLKYRLDGERQVTTRAHTVIIGNCGSLPGNVLLMPEAAVDDGLFDIVVLRPNGILGWVQIWYKVIVENGILRRTAWGRRVLDAAKDVHVLRYFTGREFVLRLSKSHDLELDGDSFGTARAIRTWVDAGGLTVRVPAGD